MKRLLRRMLDPEEFLSPVRDAVNEQISAEHPYVLNIGGEENVVALRAGANRSSGLFGGNSNWRGPVWLPINYLLIESLQKFHHYYGDDFKVECPTGSGRLPHSRRSRERAIKSPDRDLDARREWRAAVCGASGVGLDPAARSERYLFHEYFNGDTGAGLGASHQTGWTGLVAKLIQQQGTSGTIANRDPFTDL